MFTGIIKCRGVIHRIADPMYVFKVPKLIIIKLKPGASVAVNGICCTVIKTSRISFAVEFMPETMNITAITSLNIGEIVNVELPATPATLLSGHIVQGHIDGIGKIVAIYKRGNSWVLAIRVPRLLVRYMITKGSIAVDGISLTIIDVGRNSFRVGIIPYTWTHTNLHNVKLGTRVNIEVDILAKYAQKHSCI